MRDDEIVIYHNDLNRTILRRWTAEEKNIFMALVTKLRDLGTKRVFLGSDEVKELIRFDTRVSGRYDKILESAIKKIVQISYVEKKERKVRAMNLFSYLECDLDKKTIEAQVSDQYTYILNRLEANFSSHELEAYINLKSTYAKGIFQLLNEKKSIGKREFDIDEFRLLLDIPKSYNISSINNQVINPAIAELSDHFVGLKVKPIKKNTRGTPVIGFIFTWQRINPSKIKYDPHRFDKKEKPKPKSLAGEDNRMTKEEREEFINKKLQQKIPIKRNPEYDKDLRSLKENQLEMNDE